MNASENPTATGIYVTAGNMIDAAIAVATGKGKLSSPAETAQLLRQGDPVLAAAFRAELARQVAGALLMLDRAVLEVYQECTQVRSSHNENMLGQPLRLWVLARYRTPALFAAIDELNAALVKAYAAVSDSTPPSLLQTIVVDSRDGYLLRGSDFWHGEEPVLLASRPSDDALITESAAS